jgi:hypothetical protein
MQRHYDTVAHLTVHRPRAFRLLTQLSQDVPEAHVLWQTIAMVRVPRRARVCAPPGRFLGQRVFLSCMDSEKGNVYVMWTVVGKTAVMYRV